MSNFMTKTTVPCNNSSNAPNSSPSSSFGLLRRSLPQFPYKPTEQAVRGVEGEGRGRKREKQNGEGERRGRGRGTCRPAKQYKLQAVTEKNVECNNMSMYRTYIQYECLIYSIKKCTTFSHFHSSTYLIPRVFQVQ